MNENLEFLMIEISKPRSKPFLVGTWYRPPNSQRELLSLFEDSVERIDIENINSELYLLGDLIVTYFHMIMIQILPIS